MAEIIKKSHTNEQNELIPGLPYEIALECILRVPVTCHPTLRLVSRHWRATLFTPSFFSLRRQSRTAERLVFLVQPSSPSPQQKLCGGKDDADESGFKETDDMLCYGLSVYNCTRREWRSLADVVIPAFAQCVAVPEVGKVVVLGGWDPVTLVPETRVLVIDFVAGVWKEGSPMPTARSFFACAVMGSGDVYVAGGHDGRKNALRTAEVYDVESNTWRVLPEMAEERDECHGVTFGSKFWVVSGYGTESQGRFRPDAEAYDPESNSWTRIDGVWPFPSHTLKSTVDAAAHTHQRPRWWCIIDKEIKEFDFQDKSWKNLKMGRVPESINGSIVNCLVDMGDGRVMVMSNGQKCDENCKDEAMCGGEGVFMVQTTNNDSNSSNSKNWYWEHVHAPSSYLGLPFSSCHLII